MTDSSMPHGDPLEPKRDLVADVEPQGTELEARLDEVEDQNLAEAGAGPDRRAPRPVDDVPQQDTGAAKLPGEDEGPTAEGGGQSLESAGGGGR